jgi:hypothetical protein
MNVFEERRETHDVHVVAVDERREERDEAERDHRELPRDRGPARSDREEIGHEAPARQDEDVHLGVPEDPEEVLVEDRVGALAHEEAGPERAVEEEHAQARRHDGHEEHREERRQEDAPRRETHLAEAPCGERRRHHVEGDAQGRQRREEHRDDPERLPGERRAQLRG